MFITALCPTFRHPELLANSLALWNMQDYPADQRHLVILDDDPTFYSQSAGNWSVHVHEPRMDSISEKYNLLIDLAPPQTEAFLVWEDDDIYLPGYVSAHAKCLETCEYSKPDWVLSDYTGKIDVERATGRFHSTIGARRRLIEAVGGWPQTKRADFDQQLMNNLVAHADRTGSPWGKDAIPFIYSWHTGAAHCQSTMRNPADETWYDRGEQAYKKVPFVGTLQAKLDERTKTVFEALRMMKGGVQ